MSTSATPLAAPYLEALAAATPTPGGGSASAVAAGMGCALLAMVAGISARSAAPDAADRLAHLGREFDASRAQTLALGADDEQAYAAYRAAAALPKATADEKATRRAALADATIIAATPPLDLVRLVAVVLDLATRALPDLSPYLAADVVTASWLLQAAGQGALAMVDVNTASMADPAVRAAWQNDAANAAAALDRALADLRAALATPAT
jgi:formiminotetrahydrofolate cyclodeaminase